MDEFKNFVTDKILDQEYWDKQYQSSATGWDLGKVSPPIKRYIDNIDDKNLRILIPGCGNTYEAECLLEKGFTNITVIDIAPTLVEKLKHKFLGQQSIKIVLGDFFEHQAVYDLIIEQTFFCALPPTLRLRYVAKMHDLLAIQGHLVGLLFNRFFDAGPPFGGSKDEYEKIFSPKFRFVKFDTCEDSIAPRAQSELWIEFEKK